MTEGTGNALRQLRCGVMPVPDAASEQRRRERIAAHVIEVQRGLARRRERQRFGLAVAVAALVAGIGVAVPLSSFRPSERSARVTSEVDAVRLVTGHVSLQAGSELTPLAHGQLELGSESVLVTPAEDGAELRLSSGAALDVAPATEVGIVRRRPTLDGFEERVRLRAGSVALRVPKLGARGKVSVQTNDALVEVHGTEFSVHVVERPPLQPSTEVDVREGRVLVRSGEQSRFLGAGDHWSSARPLLVSPDTPPPVVTHEPPRRRTRRARLPDRTPSAAASELRAQNQLLEDAGLAQKNGMPALALRRLEALITRYPDAELAHNARVERFRILRIEGRDAEAVAAARDYLERHPQGFAWAEAQQLISTLSETPP